MEPMMSFEVVVLERAVLLGVVTHIQLSSIDNKRNIDHNSNIF